MLVPRFDSLLLTGAGGALGRGLALACAAPGHVLHLCDKAEAPLAATAQACRERGASVHHAVLDVTDARAMEEWVLGAGPVSLVVASAGVSHGFGEDPALRDEQTRRLVSVNLDGALNTLLPALRVMAARPPGPDGIRGRAAAIASLAAFMPVPGAAGYSASKAAVDAWVVGTAPHARREGIVLTSICPGYVRSAMTEHETHPLPGLMEPDEAAAIILRGLAANRRRIAFPWWMQLCARTGGVLPPALVSWMMRKPWSRSALPVRERLAES